MSASRAWQGSGRVPRDAGVRQEVLAEFRKVTWPSRQELINSTVVVIVVDGGPRLLPGRASTSRWRGSWRGSCDERDERRRRPTKQWFVVHTYSGFENKVAEAHRVARQDLRHGRADRPGPGAHREGRRGPQRAEARDRAEVLPRLHAGGDGADRRDLAPRAVDAEGDGLRRLGHTSRSPLPHDEVDDILRQMEAGAEKPKPKSVFQRGDKVRVIDGPFVNFQGVVEEINPERGKHEGGGRRSSAGPRRSSSSTTRSERGS